jgi:hypothetical protein
LFRPSPFRTDERGLLGPNGPLGPAFSDDLLRMLFAALYREDPEDPTDHDLTKWGAALTSLEAFQPRTPIEAMLAAQTIATHHAIMECYARCMEPGAQEPICIKLRGNAASLTRSMEIDLRMLTRLQDKPVPPPLPDVPVAVDAVLDAGLAELKRQAGADEPDADAPAQRAWDPAGATAGLDPAAQPDADRPAGWASDARAAQGMRPAIVVPQLQPHPPVDKVLMEARIAALHQEINERLDRQSLGTPQEWYAREREEVRLRDEAAARARAEREAETGHGSA